jgi:P4 family phage/plasmid primase-like protien
MEAPSMPHYNKKQQKARYQTVLDLARAVVTEKDLITDKYGHTYQYNGQFWEPIKDRRLNEWCTRYQYRVFDSSYGYTTMEMVNLVRDLARERLGKMLKLRGEVEIPWGNISEAEVPFSNGVYNCITRNFRLHRREDFLETVWAVDYNPNAKCPKWNRYLKDCFGSQPDYKQIVAVVEEFLGYTLIQQASYKKALFCYGESNTGKTVLEKVMAGLVGKENVCHIPIDKMNNPRIVAPIHGKAVNLMSELKFDTIMADSGFKQLVSTGESIQIDPKYKDPFPYVPFCKHVVFTNEKPNIQDHSQAVFNRLIVIEFPNVIPTEKQDPGLSQKLETELEGIALKALKGLRRLTYNKGRFTMPPSVEKALASYQQETNPMYEFLEECFLSKPQGMTLMADVREAFWQYFPRTKYWSPKKITQLLKAAGCEIAETSHKGEKGKYLLGYQLKKRYQHPNSRPELDDTSEGGEAETSDF